MPTTDVSEHFALLRQDLQRLEPPFLVRKYDAAPEDFERLADEDLRCEYIDGDLIVHSPATFRHEDLASFVNALLRNAVASAPRGGFVLGSNAVMQLGARRFCPDVSVLLTAHSARIQNNRVVGPVDLAVEILSNSTREYDRQTKLPLYREGQVGEIWLIDPDRRQFEVHALRTDGYRSAVLPTGRCASLALAGLSIDVDWFWRDPLPSVLECRTAMD